ncbi:glycosyltransferase family 2 protein [Butyrivibrio sp. AD3002]|uniref:glycosyltransferase family 2 protein n=1 Tax=Butyrivibrio sp. AD3002 TaxID=1280670 RepID=UPI0003B6DE2D|nr:glycosyltransferase [Butyrivibrio sp. AD3002]
MEKAKEPFEYNQPLVSILIPNYNHAHYLDECITSALNQTYRNLEITILDNGSTDNSIEIASKYLYDRRLSICKNGINILNKSYNVLADNFANGKYMILLCADDFLFPSFIEEAVEIMETYPNVGYVHGEKDFYREDGSVEKYNSFYKCSFVAPGRSAMPIYMVTTVAHPSQGVIRRSAFMDIHGYDKEIDHMNADRTLWFYLSDQYDAAYIKEKRCGIRIGNQTETFVTQRNFQHPILCHLTIKDFVKYAKEKNIPDVYEREEEALHRLADEFLGYAAGMLAADDYTVAEQYVTYALVVNRNIVNDEAYKRLTEMIGKHKVNLDILKQIVWISPNKKRGYEPPKGYKELVLGVDYGRSKNSNMYSYTK